ncbi:MAG: hypothetical protein ACI3ZQ_09120 [Candidatus Cryptobacteroides sp.]
MKKIIAILLAVMAMAGCGGEDHSKDVLNKACDSVRGKYACQSIKWIGEPSQIDINGDGEVNDDLMKEFADMSNCMTAINAYCFVYPALDYDDTSLIDFELPVQCVFLDKRTNEFSLQNGLAGNTQFVSFGYTVNKSGEISLSVHNELNDIKTSDLQFETEYYDSQFLSGDRILSFKDGVIEVRVNYGFYDFKSGEFVQGKADFVYERKTYSL